jgi:hypothetical protein
MTDLEAVPIDALLRPAARINEIELAFHEYQALRSKLLDKSDFQAIGGKSFPKKSAWRKLAVAFGVSTEILERNYQRDDDGRIVRAEFVVKATAPNGRSDTGIGICDRSERRFSKPEHDIPATAHTRAKNRACSDLFGFGEVSAEEVSAEDIDVADIVDVADVADIAEVVPVSKERRADAKDRARKLTSLGADLGAARAQRDLPPIDQSDSWQLTAWEHLLDELETAPL